MGGDYQKALELVKKPKTLQSAQLVMGHYNYSSSMVQPALWKVDKKVWELEVFHDYKETMSSGHNREAAQMNSQVMSQHALDLCKPSRTNPRLD